MGNSQSQASSSHRDQEIERISAENEQNWGPVEHTACNLTGYKAQQCLVNNMLPKDKGCVSEPDVVSASMREGEITCNKIIDISKSNSSNTQPEENMENEPRSPSP